MGALHCLPHLLLGGAIGNTLVEAHDDVGAQADLVHGCQLRSKAVLAAVVMGAEADTIFAHLAQRTQTEGLETATVG